MITRVSVVGANGRVGSALVQYLADTHDVVAIVRSPGESPADIASRATDGVDVVVNAAGVAHLERPTPADLERLRVGNIDLPLALADAALRERAHLIHISSVKATPDATTEYGQSKYEAEQRLESEFGDRFADAGLSLVIVRPLALLIPPFHAGKLSKLKPLRWLPRSCLPPIRMPVITKTMFVETVQDLMDGALGAAEQPGYRVCDFEKSQRGMIRNVHDVLSMPSVRAHQR